MPIYHPFRVFVGELGAAVPSQVYSLSAKWLSITNDINCYPPPMSVIADKPSSSGIYIRDLWIAAIHSFNARSYEEKQVTNK